MATTAFHHPLKNNLLFFVRWGLLLVWLMPLIVNGRFVFPYIFPKQAFFQLLMEIILLAYCWLAFRYKQYRPRSSKLWWALMAYFGLMILSAFFGANAYHSFWSNYERMAGVISLLHYLGLVLVAVNVFKTRDDWHHFFGAAVISGVVEGFYALSQIVKHGGGMRVDGTIGNSSFLAGYMLICFFFALWLLMERKNLFWRIFCGAAMVFNLAILYQTQTRGAVLGLAAGGLFLSFFLIFGSQRSLSQLSFGNPKRLRIVSAGILLSACVLVAVLFFFRDSAFVLSRPTLTRVTHISLEDSTTQTRLMAWRMSWQGFLEKPLLGWGQENYYIVFNKYYNPLLYPIESWFDRSHNAFLDILVHNGFLGFLGYLAVFGLALNSLWRSYLKEKINYQTAAIFTAILAAYFVQNFFVFDTQVTLILIYSILAFLVYLSFINQPDETATVGSSLPPNFFFKAITIVALLPAIYFFNIKPGLAGKTGIDAMTLLQQGQLSESLAKFNESFEIGTFGLPEVALRVMEGANGLWAQFRSEMSVTQKSAISSEQVRQFALAAVDGLKKSLEKEPLNARFVLMLSSLYLNYVDLDTDYINQAAFWLEKAEELSPTRQEVYFYQGQLLFDQKKYDEVLPVLKKAVDLNNQAAASHWHYGIAALVLGQRELGEEEVDKAISLGHVLSSANRQLLVSFYKSVLDYEKIPALYQRLMKQEPKNTNLYAELAVFYKDINDLTKARETAEKIISINPDLKLQVDEFVRGLNIE